jgi:hypothetical protein
LKRTTAGQIRPKTTRESYVTLPIQLRDDIKQLPLTKTQISHCYKFVGILYRDSIAEHWDATMPTPKPQNYLIKAFDDKYYKWLNVLLNNNIVIRSETPCQVIHKSYKYVVNPKYVSNLSKPSQSLLVNLDSNPINVLCKEKYWEPLSALTYKDIIKNETQENFTYRKWFTDDINTLNIQYDLLYDIALKRIEELTIDEFIVDNEILPPSIKVRSSNGVELFQNTQKVISSLLGGQCLIKDNSIYKVVYSSKFLSDKKATMKMYYKNSIDRLRYNSFDAKRNTTNNRLDTNLTNMASILVDAICLQNDLIQIDLSNSQFVLLSNMLKDHLNTDDYRLYKELSVDGNLYTYIANKLGLKSFKNGKSLMFEVLFSSRRNSSVFKKKIKVLFPSVVEWIDKFKKEHGDNQFSIMLQRIESDLFIDKVLKRLKKLNYFCLTKHDSLIIKRGDYKAIMDIVKDEFANIGLEYTLKITNLFGINEEHKILWNHQAQIESEVVKKQDLIDDYINIHELTAIDIRELGYTEIEFRTSFGQVLYVPRIFEMYWSSIQSKLGVMKRLSRENDQLGFDIELRSILQNMFELKSAV